MHISDAVKKAQKIFPGAGFHENILEAPGVFRTYTLATKQASTLTCPEYPGLNDAALDDLLFRHKRLLMTLACGEGDRYELRFKADQQLVDKLIRAHRVGYCPPPNDGAMIALCMRLFFNIIEIAKITPRQRRRVHSGQWVRSWLGF